MEKQIVKIQRREVAVFVTIPSEFTDDLKNVTHMRVFKNTKGNLEYEAIGV